MGIVRIILNFELIGWDEYKIYSCYFQLKTKFTSNLIKKKKFLTYIAKHPLLESLKFLHFIYLPVQPMWGGGIHKH